MPNVVGLSKEDAMTMLRSKKLEFDEKEFKEELSDQYDAGYIHLFYLNKLINH